jgi:enamine deaminase RidA (YjgF/YER057c/UK114 family)
MNSTTSRPPAQQKAIPGAEQRIASLGITLPEAPKPFGTYAEAVQSGNLLFLTGMLPTEGRSAKFTGRVGDDVDADSARRAARLAALNSLAVARGHLGTLDRIGQVVRLGVMIATAGQGADLPAIADGASDLLQDVFGKDMNPCRLVYGVASLPLSTPIELEVIFEIKN